jgi:hypothetical protein
MERVQTTLAEDSDCLVNSVFGCRQRVSRLTEPALLIASTTGTGNAVNDGK